MFRLSAILLAESVAVAADPPAVPVTAHHVTLATVTLKDGALVQTVSVCVPETVDVTVEEEVNGQKVKTVKKVTRVVCVPSQQATKLKEVTVTGTDGKAISEADLEKRLKGGGQVVMLSLPLTDEFRKLFKDGTVFVERPAPVVAAPVQPKPPEK